MARNAYIATPSTAQVVTTSEAKTHLRVSHTDDDSYIEALCFAAQETVEKYCNIILMDTAIIQRCDTWKDVNELYFSPIENSGEGSITYIKYKDDTTGALTVWPDTNYIFDKYSCPMRIGIADDGDATLPSLLSEINAIEISYSVGYSSVGDIPKAIKQAILILVGQWYENRQEAVVGRSVGIIPMTATYLLDKFKIRTFGLPC